MSNAQAHPRSTVWQASGGAGGGTQARVKIPGDSRVQPCFRNVLWCHGWDLGFYLATPMRESDAEDTSSTTHVDVRVPSRPGNHEGWEPGGNLEGLHMLGSQNWAWVMPRIRQDQREDFGQQWARSTAASTGWVARLAESRLSEVLQAEKSWALTAGSFQVSWNGRYAVGNKVGLNAMSRGGARQAGRGEAWTDFRLWDWRARRRDCGRGMLPEGGPD